MAVQIQLRRDSAADWTSANPTLAQGEVGYETDTNKLKIGDGSTAWTSLAYFRSGIGTATASGTDTYTATIAGVTAYATHDVYEIIFTNGNTGSSTININSLGAKTLKKSVSTNLASGDINAGQSFFIVYDGTNFQVIGLGGGGGSVSDTAYGVSWNGSTTTAPSQNAVYDKIELLAPLASPTFTGTPAAPTATVNTNTTQIATTAFVQTQIANEASIANVGAKLYLFNAY